MDLTAPWKRRAEPRTGGWHMIAEIDVARLLVQHSDQRRLCEALERLADQLPRLPDQEEAERLAARLLAFARESGGEEEALARLGLDPDGDAAGLLPVLGRWRMLDALHAQDLAEILAGPEREDQTCDGEQLAYMLRCFFEGCRRTVALSEAAILLLGRGRLTRAATESVRASLARA